MGRLSIENCNKFFLARRDCDHVIVSSAEADLDLHTLYALNRSDRRRFRQDGTIPLLKPAILV